MHLSNIFLIFHILGIDLASKYYPHHQFWVFHFFELAALDDSTEVANFDPTRFQLPDHVRFRKIQIVPLILELELGVMEDFKEIARVIEDKVHDLLLGDIRMESQLVQDLPVSLEAIHMLVQGLYHTFTLVVEAFFKGPNIHD